MTMHRALLVAAALIGLPFQATAQETIRIEPKEAMQCAVWASMMSGAVTDEQAKQALGYSLSYFVGQYEGATGKSILEGHDEAAIREVALHPDAFSTTCQQHMAGFGPRMVEWGGVLNEVGARIGAEQGAQQGK